MSFAEDTMELKKSLLKEVAVHLRAIIKLKKEGNMKDLIKHHKKIDELLHSFVGKKGLAPGEK